MSATIWDLVIRRDDLTRAEIVPSSVGDQPPAEGQALFRVESLALTANNITYGALGDLLGYWDLFPAAEGWGRIPAWGYTTVVGTACDDVEVGQQFFGLVPMSTHFTGQPIATRGGFRDAGGHRANVNPVYNRYANVDGRSADSLEQEAALRPVFILSFVLAEYLREHGWFGAAQVVITSASSKAAIGLASLLAGDPTVTATGPTSAPNQDFVASLGLYDCTVVYGDVSDVPDDQPTVVIDVSGDGAVMAALRDRLGRRIVRVVGVGQTHWDRTGDPGGPGEPGQSGPPGEMFFAPVHIQRLVAEWGAAEFEERFAAALGEFATSAQAWLAPRHHDGAEALSALYADLVAGRIDPRSMTIVRPND